LAHSKDQEAAIIIRKGISAVESENYLLGLTILSEAYRSGRVASPEGLSYYGLCLALVERKYKNAIDFCKKAIELQFYNPYHYANLCRVYMAAGARRRAFEILQEGLRVMPEEEMLLTLRGEFGLRARPPLPFLARNNPLNEMIGKALTKKKKTK
jgi:tetratricopeptide (TPR) repeat protein